jgi:hypothetical protein
MLVLDMVLNVNYLCFFENGVKSESMAIKTKKNTCLGIELLPLPSLFWPKPR